MGIGALVGGALGFFGGGGIIGGIVGLAGGLLSGRAQKQSPQQQAESQQVSKESGRGASRVRQARAQRSRASQLQTAMSFDGIGNENGKIPFVRSDQNAPLDEQQSIFQ